PARVFNRDRICPCLSERVYCPRNRIVISNPSGVVLMNRPKTTYTTGLVAFLAFWAYCHVAATEHGDAKAQPSAPSTAHFHHIHVNPTDAAAAINFYTNKFDCEKARFEGVIDAVWAQKSWLLFNKVNRPPPWELTSAIWHIGWGAEDMKSTYQKQLDSGTRFFTPLSDISDLAGV